MSASAATMLPSSSTDGSRLFELNQPPDLPTTDHPARPAEQIGWFLAALTVAFWGFRIWTGATLFSAFSVLGPALVLLGLLGAVAAWTASGRWNSLLRVVLAPAWLAGFAGYCLLTIATHPGYGTDALAFNQQAAATLLHGVNPYSVSYGPALDHLLVPDTYHTWLLSGRQVDALSYPALSFLVYVPALALGAGMQAANVMNFGAWALAVLLLWRLLPRSLRWAALLIGTFTPLLALALGGVTDAIFLPFLMIACWRWDRFADNSEAGLARWAGPIALGLAMSVKQTPWFVLPFLLLGLTLEARARAGARWWHAPLQYLGVVSAVFAVVNLPFFIWSPSAFVHGMLLPLLEPLVPAGQGLIALALFHHLGGHLTDFTIAGLAALPVALLLFLCDYRRMRYALIPLASLVFFWATRSYESYLIDMLPAAIVAAATIRPAGSAGDLQRLRRPLVGALVLSLVALVGAVSVALGSSQPLRLQIVSMHSTGQQDSVRQMTVKVTNLSDSTAHPVFSVMSGEYLSRPWREVSGPTTISPQASTTVTLQAPNAQAMPSLQGGWLLTAFQTRPELVSTSNLVQGDAQQLTFYPSSINAPVPLGVTVTLEVQLRSRLGSPERRAGVPVDLGQIVYEEQGDLAGEAQINDHQLGESPVTALTDADGIAHFSIRAAQALPAPVFFQAWIAPQGGVPHAYSDQLAIQFIDRNHR